MTRKRGIFGLVVIFALTSLILIAAPGRSDLRNFGTVEDGVLYRSGQLTPAAFDRVVRDYRIRTVVTLRPTRDPGANSDTWEEDVCRALAIKHFRIALQVSGADEMDPAGLGRVARAFLEVMDDPANHPVLVHCVAGRDRTGTVCAVYRMEHDRWSADRALGEMREYGFDPNKDAPATYYANFVRNYRVRR